MKRFLAISLVLIMVMAFVPAFAAAPAATTQRTTKLDLTQYNYATSNSAEGWSYDPTGNNGQPLLALDNYGTANAHSAPILCPANTSIEVTGNCYIDNALMGEKCDCISGSWDGYLNIFGRGTLNLYATEYHGRGISVPTGGVSDGSEILYIEDITVNYYGMERTIYTAFYLEGALYGNEGVELHNMTLNMEEGGYLIWMQGYGVAYPYTEDNVSSINIEGCDINVHNVTGDNWLYAKGIFTPGGNINIKNSNIYMEAGCHLLYTHYRLTIDEGSNIDLLAHPLTTAAAHAIVYYNRMVIKNGIERFHVKLTKYTVGDVLAAREEYTSELGSEVTITKGSFENGNFHGITPTQENWPEFEAIGNYVQPTYYTVNFYDYDGTLLSTQQVEEGQAAVAPAAPAHEGMVFTGWSASFSNVTGDLDVYAVYESVAPAVYTVNFYDYDGTLLSTQQVEEGQAAVAPEVPTHFGMVFKGWDVDFSCITGDLNVTAIFAFLGDADCNGVVTFADVSMIYLFLMGSGQLSAQGRLNSDFDQNGNVDFADISEIYLYVLGN